MKIQKQITLLMLILVMCMLSACTTQSSSNQIVQGRRGTGTPAKAAEEAVLDTETVKEEIPAIELFVVIRIDTEQKKVSFREVNSGRESEYMYDVGTQFLDKYGNTRALTSFVPGDVVEVQATGVDRPLKCVQLSDDVWVQEQIFNYSIDENICALTIGKTKYHYDEDMEAFSGDKLVKMRNISQTDEIRVTGIDKEIISVVITKGHGYVMLTNTEIFDGSFVCVGEKIFQEVTPNMQIEVPEGKHLVTVANNGYGGSKEVVVERDKITKLNLDKIKGEGPKICKITFKVGVEGAILQIDGKDVDYSEPVEVQYGIHRISVIAEGYDTISEKLVVNSKEAEIEIGLTSASSDTPEEDIKTGESTKINEGDSADNSGSGTANNGNTNMGNTNTGNTNTNNGNAGTNGTDTNTNTNNGNAGTDDTSTDYLTTLYNLLNSINNSNNTGNNAGTTNGYDDLHDG